MQCTALASVVAVVSTPACIHTVEAKHRMADPDESAKLLDDVLVAERLVGLREASL